MTARSPRDLDAPCRLTLNEDQGPTNPGDYARQVAPWPSRQVVGRPVARMAAAPAAAAAVAAAHLGAAEASAPEQATEAESVTQTESVTQAESVTQIMSTIDPETPVDVVEFVDAEAPRWTTRWPYPCWPVPGPRPRSMATTCPMRQSLTTRPAPTSNRSRAAYRAARHPAPPLRGGGSRRRCRCVAVAGALGTVGGRVGDMAKRAVDKVAELSPRHRTAHQRRRTRGPRPLVPAEPLSKDESKLALGIVASFLVLALVIGVWGMSRIGSSTREIFGGDAAAPFPSASAASRAPQRAARPLPPPIPPALLSRWPSSRSRPTTRKATARRTTS